MSVSLLDIEAAAGRLKGHSVVTPLIESPALNERAGGRVLGVTAVGPNVIEAIRDAYQAIGDDGVHFPDMVMRHDIGWRALLDGRSDGNAEDAGGA